MYHIMYHIIYHIMSRASTKLGREVWTPEDRHVYMYSQEISSFFCFCLTTIDKIEITASYDNYSCQNSTKKMPEGVFAPPPE